MAERVAKEEPGPWEGGLVLWGPPDHLTAYGHGYCQNDNTDLKFTGSGRP